MIFNVETQYFVSLNNVYTRTKYKPKIHTETQSIVSLR